MCKNLSYKILFVLSFILTNTLSKAQFISVDTNYNAQQLVDKFLGTNSSCITVTNVTVKGWNFGGNDLSYGYFTKGTSNFDIDEGIILSTGKALSAPGPNNTRQSEGNNTSWGGDRELENAININSFSSYNATVLEFDFVSASSSKIYFDYMFLSEQYLRNMDTGSCDYTDGFSFLIKKKTDSDYKNLAVIPNTDIPIKSNTVRGGGEKCSAINTQYFGQYSYGNSPTNFNGETKILTATTDIDPGETYHIKLVVADQGNGLYDSAVFLKAGSFVGNISLGQDLTMENNTALCTSGTYTINAKPDPAQGIGLYYTWKKDGIIITSAQDQPTYTVDYADPGLYEVEVELASGCLLRGHIIVEQQILPVTNLANINVCDDNLDEDNTTNINLIEKTTDIVTNNQQSFDIRYFENQPSDISNPGAGISELKFTGSSKTIYMWIKPGNCPPKTYPITFIKNQNSPYDTSIKSFDLCDKLLDNHVQKNLEDYLKYLNPNYVGKPIFYSSKKAANTKDTSKQISEIQQISATNHIFYARFKESGYCDNVAEININFKQPAKSTSLKDISICKNTTTTLDAGVGPGTGFTSYEWSIIDPTTLTNATTQKIENVPVGVYTVKLGYNGCFYTQTVEVKEAPTAIIDAIDINGSTVTVKAIGGTAPYKYSLDDNTFPDSFQDSPTFTNVSLGNHTIYVKSNDLCGLVSRDFSVVNIANVISPNADGKNDVINLSELLNKTEARFKVYNRNGVLVFEGNSANQFIWDGKQNGRVLPTGTYWYVADWIEPTSGKSQQLKSWILLKNY